MKYRKKPVVIDAVQFDPARPEIEGVCYTPACLFTGPDLVHIDGTGKTSAHIHTLEGIMIVSLGDWVITGIKGERYPCKDEIFRATYDEIRP